MPKRRKGHVHIEERIKGSYEFCAGLNSTWTIIVAKCSEPKHFYLGWKKPVGNEKMCTGANSLCNIFFVHGVHGQGEENTHWRLWGFFFKMPGVLILALTKCAKQQ